MKRTILMILICTFSLVLVGCNFIEEKKAEVMIKDYYQAIKDGNYEKAFEQLYLYDYDADAEDSKLVEGTALSNEEAKAFYLKKTKFLKELNYQLKNFEIVDIEYEDGHSFWHHIKLEVEKNDEVFEWTEIADIYKGKLLIGEIDDLYAKYRNGEMGFKMKELKES